MAKLFENITFKQAHSDYHYIIDNYGKPNDFCGNLCNCDLLTDLLEGNITRKEAYIQMIDYIFANGLESPDAGIRSDIFPPNEDKRIREIKERYYID